MPKLENNSRHTVKQLGTVLVSAMSFLLAAVLLAGLPIALIGFVGNPFPTSLPTFEQFRWSVQNGQISDDFWIGLLAMIVWVVWAQLVLAFVVEIAASVRGIEAPSLPGFGFAQDFAYRLIARITLTTSLLVSSPAVATFMSPAPAVAHVGTVTDVASTLRVPRGTARAVEVLDPVAGATITVERRQTLYGLAETHLGSGDNWAQIRDANVGRTMKDGTLLGPEFTQISPGWTLVIPESSGRSRTAAEPDATVNDLAVSSVDEVSVEYVVGTYTVTQGDHFWKISERVLTEAYGRPVSDTEIRPYWLDVIDANRDRIVSSGADPNLIYPAQEFEILLPPLPAERSEYGERATSTPFPITSIEPTRSSTDARTDADFPQPEPAGQTADDTKGGRSTVGPLRPGNDSALADESAKSAPDESVPAMGPGNAGPSQGDLANPAERAPLQPAEPQSPASDSSSGARDVAGQLAIATGVSGLLGALLVTALRRLRTIQAARRRPGTTTELPNVEAQAFEERVRAVSSDGEDVRYLNAVNSYLSLQVESHAGAEIPSVVAARAGQFGVELMLDDPCSPLPGFVSVSPNNRSWRLHPDTTSRMMEADIAAADPHPFLPALLAVGQTPAGALLVDFEQLDAVAVEGNDNAVADFQRGLLTAAMTAPWATECRIVSIGLDGLSDSVLSRVEQPDDPIAWASQTGSEMKSIAAQLARSPYEQRARHGDVYHPMIVVIGRGEQQTRVAQYLAPIAELAYAPLVVVCADPITSEYRIVLSSEASSLEPFGLGFSPVQVPSTDLGSVDTLLASASDTSPTPSVDEWAAELDAEAARSRNGHPNGTIAARPELNDADSHGDAASVEPVPPVINVDRPRGPTIPPPSVGEMTEATETTIAQILAPQPVEVCILDRHPSITGMTGDASPKLTAIIAYLAFHRSVASQRLRDEFWPGSTKRQAADNAITKARTLLGSSPDQLSRLESAANVGTYTLSDEVGTDWHRAQQLMAEADAATDEAAEAAFLDAACELIAGPIGADASPANYSWLLRDVGTYAEIETTLVDAAHRRGELALAAGDTKRANWAARKGLLVVEGQESLYRIQMRAAAEAGNTDGVKSAYREAQLAAESYGYDEELQPETQSLFEALTSGSRTASDVASS